MKAPIHIILRAILIATLLIGFGESRMLAQDKPDEEKTALLGWIAQDNKAVKEAEKLADNHEYAEAVRVLELAMVTGDTSETLLMNLASYYKKTGNLRMATSLIMPLVDKERPRPWHLLEVAGMLVDQGRFTDAEPYLQRFEELKPEDKRADMLRRKAKERVAISSLYPTARLDTFLHNTLADEGFPFRRDSQIYWSSDRDGAKKKSGWTGRAMVCLYEAQIQPEHGYGDLSRVEAKFNKGVINTASPCLSASGDTLYYTANAEVPNRKGELNMQLYFAVKRGDEWKSPERIASQPEQANCIHPTLSPDGEWLYFAADASDSRGGLDIYRMPKEKDGTWGRPDNLGSVVNTDRHDGFPVAAENGKVYFASKGHVGLGGFDLFVTTDLGNGKWSEPINLGEPVNSKSDETNWVVVKRGFAYLVSNRTGGDDDIYEVRW